MGLETVMAALALTGQAAPEVLTPSGKWAVAHEPTECLLTRQFGSGDQAVTFGVLRLPDSPGGTVLLVASTGIVQARRGSGRVVLQPSGERFATSWAIAPRAGQAGGVTRIEPTVAFWDALPQATALTFEGNGGSPIQLPVGEMKAALSAYDACNDAMLRRWGADPAAMIKQGPWIARWFMTDYSPDPALRRRATGRSVALIAIGPDGRPTGCTTVKSSGVAELDKASCAIVSKEVRVPAGADDRRMDRWLVMPVSWR